LDALPEAKLVRGTIFGEVRPNPDAFRYSGRVQQYGAFLVRIAFLLDAGVLYCALYLTVRLNGFAWGQRYVTLALLSVVLFNLVSSFRSLYRSWRLEQLQKELAEVTIQLTFSSLILAGLIATGTNWGSDDAFLRLLGQWWVLSLLGIACGRAAVRVVLRFWRAGPSGHRQVAFYGATSAARHLARVFRQHPWMGLDVMGFYDDVIAERQDPSLAEVAGGLEWPDVAGGLDALVQMAKDRQISAVYITVREAGEGRIKDILNRFGDTTVSLHYCPALFDLDMLGARWDDVFGLPVISVVTSPFDELRRHLKRLEDLALTLLLLPILGLPILGIALAVKLTSRGPALYVQQRHGLGGRPFKILKFRTMYTMDSDEEFVQAKTNDSRVTPLGAFLRRTSLDELPQLVNVLLGDMSIVGPRPAPLKYNNDHRGIIYRYMVRHKVKPGITGLAQVNGCRGETDSLDKTERRTSYDLAYIDNWSLWLDLKILWKTAIQMIWDFRSR
jgi:putative colanic acid biosynthesis UDP-glucose lipid carrier transferase